MAGHPEIQRHVGEEVPVPSPAAETPTANGPASGAPRVVQRDGVAYIEGCDVAIWQLEMSRRAGSTPAALLEAFRRLTPEGLDVAFAYARQHREEVDALIRDRGPAEVPAEDGGEDDEEEIRADLDEIFEKYDRVFRRLAQ